MMPERSGEERRKGERRCEDRRQEDRQMAFKKFGVEWRYDTLIGFVSLIIACVFCTYSIDRRLTVNSDRSIQASEALRESLDHASRSEGDIIKQVTQIEAEQRVLEDKLADREESLKSLSRLIRQTNKKNENK